MNDIKCVFLDIDGTVDNEKKITTRYTKNVLKKLSNKDIKTVICSGRMASYAISKSKGANCSNIVIADNGSLIYDYSINKVIFESVFNKRLLNRIGNICRENKVECLFNVVNGCYRYGDYNYHKYKRGKNIKNIDSIKVNVTQIIISSIYLDDMKKVLDLILKTGEIQVSNTNMHKDLPEGNAYYCDLNIKGNSKGKAILELIKYLGIDYSGTMCFGDSLNDLSMFETCHYKIAMKNASDDLKNLATSITEYDNNHDGVAKYIEENIL